MWQRGLLEEFFADLKRFFFASKKRMLFGAWLALVVAIILFQIASPSSFATNAAEQKRNLVTGASVVLIGLSTALFWVFRSQILGVVNGWAAAPRTKFVAIGCLGAAWAEFVVWAVEKFFGASGVAANPDFLLDLAATMPWYAVMVFLLWEVETAFSYSFAELLFLGGVYDFFADGILGLVLKTGGIAFEYVVLFALFLPEFVILYSVIVLPPSFLLRTELAQIRAERPLPSTNKYFYALLPLLGLIPYFALFVLVSKALGG